MSGFNTFIAVTLSVFCLRTTQADSFFLGLGDLPSGGFQSGAKAISADGSTVVGYGYGETGLEAFRWTSSDGMVGLGFVSPSHTTYSEASGVSADGSVVVGASAKGGGGTQAFRWTASEGMVGLGFLPGGGTYGAKAWSTSGDGSVIVGYSDTSTAYMQAYRWTQADGMVVLPDLPEGDEFSEALGISDDGAVIVGQGTSAAGIEACRWTAQGASGLGSLPGGEYRSMAWDASANGGVIVGASSSASSGPDSWEAFLYGEDKTFIGLGDLPGGAFYSFAYAVSADGSLVVGGSESDRGVEALIWDSDHGMRSLYDVLTDDLGLDLSGWELTYAADVSADGLTIVGIGTNPAGDTEAWIAHIPEPATLCLAALGLALACRRRGQIPRRCASRDDGRATRTAGAIAPRVGRGRPR